MKDPVPTPSPTPSPVERQAPRPPVPSLPGDGVLHDPVPNHRDAVGRGTRQPTFEPGTTWLVTPRTTPAWTAVLNLLDDDHWHPTSDVTQVMRDTANLADRTIANHLHSASRRGWIQNSRGRVRLRNRELIEAALDAMDGSR